MITESARNPPAVRYEANLNLLGFIGNLISVTTGNIFGGGFMVALVNWFIYRRPRGGE